MSKEPGPYDVRKENEVLRRQRNVRKARFAEPACRDLHDRAGAWGSDDVPPASRAPLVAGPFPYWTLIYCRSDEFGVAKVAAFPGAAEASDHALNRLRRAPREWVSVVVAKGVSEDLEFIGSWDRDHDGAILWQAASLA